MSTDKRFSSHEDELKEVVDEVKEDLLNDKEIEPEDYQKTAEKITSEIINRLGEKNLPFKFVCRVLLLQKKDCQLNFSSTQVWEESVDGVVRDKFENEAFKCLIYLYTLKY